MEGINLEKHYALTSSIEVKELVEPLLKSIGLSYFNYIKIYNHDCSRELLTNNPGWINHFYKQALFNSTAAVNIEHLLPRGYFLWSELDDNDPIYLQGRDFFNIDHGISFITKREDVTYLHIFAANQKQYEMNNFYRGNLDLLQRFIYYFNDRGQHLIKEAEKHRIYLPKQQSINPNRINNGLLSEEAREKFLKQTTVNQYFLLNISDKLYLTNKQAEFAHFLVRGYTSKQIAQRMNISSRTAEGYMVEVKNKLQHILNKVLNKSEIIQLLRSSNLA